MVLGFPMEHFVGKIGSSKSFLGKRKPDSFSGNEKLKTVHNWEGLRYNILSFLPQWRDFSDPDDSAATRFSYSNIK